MTVNAQNIVNCLIKFLKEVEISKLYSCITTISFAWVHSDLKVHYVLHVDGSIDKKCWDMGQVKFISDVVPPDIESDVGQDLARISIQTVRHVCVIDFSRKIYTIHPDLTTILDPYIKDVLQQEQIMRIVIKKERDYCDGLEYDAICVGA